MSNQPWRSPMRRVTYAAVVGALRGLLLISSRVRVLHRDRLPPTGPVILASNHVSHFDPPLLSVHTPRAIDWIAMRELHATGWSRRFFRALNTIPIQRGAPDRAALREACARLADGRVVGIFPEGGIRDGGDSLLAGAEPLRGLPLLARLSGAPVLPCAIVGSERLYNMQYWKSWARAPVWIFFGEPIPGGVESSELLDAVRGAFRGFFPELEARHGARSEDFPRSPRARMEESP